ncbi:MAG TPA: FAD-binding oxidoreductase [Blastocatellia bacterium]|nr:FAD-binding oxidoreductase [Blastocatellia bacterium]
MAMQASAKADLIKSLEAVIGREFVTPEPELRIDGLQPGMLARPGSAPEVAECLRVCAAANAAIIPAGFMTWLDGGNPVARADVVLSLERMNRIIEYSPADLTATVEAGLALSDFNTATVRDRQWLPFDPPGAARASLGALAACASSGPFRAGFGTPRDYVIGLKLAHADGTESKCGGRVVKNVAGYDLNKLYVGSFGTLAVLTELTFKLRPLPEKFATVRVTANQQSSLFETANRILNSELQPASAFIAKDLTGEGSSLLVRFADSEAAVAYQADRTAQMLAAGCKAEILGDDADAVWSQVANLDSLAGTALRLSVPLSAVRSTFERLLALRPDCIAAADVGAGIIRIAFDLDEAGAINLIESTRAEIRGSLFVERASPEVRRRADAWGDIRQAAGLMKAVKAKFDPQSLLNPGRFVCGI